MFKTKELPENFERVVGIATLVLNGLLTTVQIVSLLRSSKEPVKS